MDFFIFQSYKVYCYLWKLKCLNELFLGSLVVDRRLMFLQQLLNGFKTIIRFTLVFAKVATAGNPSNF